MSESARPRPGPLMWLPFYAWKYLVIIPFLALSTLVIGLIIIPLCFLGFPDFASRVFATAWARMNAMVTLLTISVEGRENIRPGESYVIVANHQSLLDIYAVYGHSGLELKWVMKQELRKVPVLGYACELMGHIIIDRSNTDAALATINSAREKIQGGMCVIFFPEGTRSRDGKIMPFKKGAFRFAIELGIPILPVSIHGTRDVLPSDGLAWYPGHAHMEIHEPIPTAGLDAGDVPALTRQAEEVISTALTERPNQAG